MSTVSESAPVSQNPFDALLGELAGNMRLYDTVRQGLISAAEIAEWALQITDAPDPERVAEAVVEAQLYRLTSDGIQTALREIAHRQDEAATARLGQEVVLRTLDDRGSSIGASSIGGSRQRESTGNRYKERKGKIGWLSLHPGYGGAIQLLGESKFIIYGAGPLVDRHRGFEPRFSITPL